MDIITGFENYVKRYFPPSLKEIIRFQLDAGVRLEFEVPDYDRFELLDYTTVLPLINQAGSADAGNRAPDPYYHMLKIDSYLQDFYPVIQFKDILPFARNTWGDQTIFLFTESLREAVILVDLDSAKKPFVLKSGIESLINIRQLTKTDGSLFYDARQKFDDILPPGTFTSSLPDWVSSVEIYRELINRCMTLIGSGAECRFEPLESTGHDAHRFRISDGNLSADYTIRNYDGLVVREDFLTMLNDFLEKSAWAPDRRFYQLSDKLYYFGVACTDHDTAEKLRMNGYLQRGEKDLAYSEEEKEQIRRAQDVFREIENMQFCLKVMNQKLSPEYRGQTVSVFYETGFSFDPAGMELVKKMTNIEDLEKEVNGYNLIFTVE